MHSTTPTVICSVINKQHWSHKCGCQYIHYNCAPYTHHKLRRWSAFGNTKHTLPPHPLPHLAWRPRGATQQSVDCESLTPTRGATQKSVDCESLTPTRGATQKSVDCESLTPTRGATQKSVDCESLTPTRGATQKSVDCESLTPTRGATQKSVDCESLTPTRGATQQSVDCESLTPTRGATQQSVDSKIVPVSSIAPEGCGPKEGGNATSPLHSRGSPTKGTKSEVKTYAGGHHDAPSISKCGSLVHLVQPCAQIAALC